MSNATQFSGTPRANANALGEWSREYDKSEDKGSKCAGVQQCRVFVLFNTLPQLGWLCAQADRNTHRCWGKTLHSHLSPCICLANALHCGVAVTDLHAHVIFSTKPRPSTARVPVLLCSFPKIFGADAQILAAACSVQRKCSVPAVMTFPPRSSYVFFLSALSEVDLGDVSKPETM